ncbi:hypothetical protein GBF38_009293 [Nibea albiflora]|uniref:Uncharacterized protein n=1 Tax=Nibea albiflora TaxID=240163 RepID=A0ACB7EQ53_NIBAL|nr:hypothetical protein GBF38_009293 [Nibea albiflora]
MRLFTDPLRAAVLRSIITEPAGLTGSGLETANMLVYVGSTFWFAAHQLLRIVTKMEQHLRDVHGRLERERNPDDVAHYLQQPAHSEQSYVMVCLATPQSAGTSQRLRPGFRQSAGRLRDYVQVLDSLRGRLRDYVQVLDSLRGLLRDYVQVLDGL